MKRPIIITTITLGLACVCATSVAQDQPSTANLQHVTVTAVPNRYETYAVSLDTGFGLEVRVGNRHGQYVQAARVTERLEALRRQGMARSPNVNVAIDNSRGESHAWQVLLSDRGHRTLAIVNVYCKHFARDAGKRCQLVPQPVSGSPDQQEMAARRVGNVSLAEVRAGSH